MYDLRVPNAYIFSAAKVLGIRIRFQKRTTQHDPSASMFNVTVEYGFLKKAYFRNDGRLIAGSFCDYYFFANADANEKMLETWQYFHSPRFPANYPAHIKCSYKFIGRPETRVEIILEELHIPRLFQDCNLDKLTVFDSESANMNAVVDVLCDTLPARRIISSGPDLLIEFNASSNVTAKGFRGKFRFPQNNQAMLTVQDSGKKTASVVVRPAASVTTNTTSKNPTTKELKVAAFEKVSPFKTPTPALMNLIDNKKKTYKSGGEFSLKCK